MAVFLLYVVAGMPALLWWQTWWLWALLLVSTVLAGAVYSRFRLQALRRRYQGLEQEVRERTAEVQSKTAELERQNKRLEVNNTIIKFINARIGFSDLLQTILEGVIFVQSADRALALVACPENERFASEAASGWRFGSPDELELTKTQIEDEYLTAAREVAPGIWIGPPSPSRLLEEEKELGGPACSVLVMRIEVEDDVAGYLIIHHLRDDDAFDHEDLETLEDLKDHMASAFLKGRMMQELRELNEKKNEFLGIAAHDLRNPLTGVIGFTELLLQFLQEKRHDPELWQRFLENVRNLGDDMRAMINQLLDVTAIETGKVSIHLELQRYNQLLRKRSELHSVTAKEKGIELELDTGAAEVDIMIDRIRLSEVLDNLLSNAIKFTWPGGRVRLFCELQNGEVITHVEDNGQGLEDYELNEVFSGKKLSARPTAGEPSTGLGLVIVKKIVELHRGRVWVESKKAEGSIFSFSLPRHEHGDGDNAPADNAPADNAPADNAPADNAPADNARADNARADGVPQDSSMSSETISRP